MAIRSLFSWLSEKARKHAKEGKGKMRTNTRKFRLALTALTLVALLLAVFGAVPAWAATPIYVRTGGDDANCNGTADVDYSPGVAPNCAVATIKKGVELVDPAGTVYVAGGTYDEMVTISKAVTLRGANWGVHPAVGTHPTEVVGTRGSETILSHNYYAIEPAADNITINGFKFTGAGGRIIDTYANANGFHLTNCIFENPARAVTQGVIQFGGGSHVDMLIDYNLFQDQGDHTLYFGGGPYDDLHIAYNKFNGLGDGVFWAATPLVDGVVEGNEFDGTIGVTPGQGGTGMNRGEGGNIIIRDNWFHDMLYTGFQVGIVGGSVTDNTFEDTHPLLDDTTWYPSSAFELWGGEWGTSVSTNVTITGNTIRFNDQSNNADEHGIRLRTGADAPNIHVNCNNFIDGGVSTTALAVRNQGTGILDAEHNWWGDPSGPGPVGPGTGGKVSDNVEFDPWLPDLFQYCPVCGGTPRPVPVGGVMVPVNKVELLAPWMGLAALMVAAVAAVVVRRRMA